MTYKLFVDDVRDAPDASWVVTRDVQSTKDHLSKHGIPDEMSLDHDLGGEETGMQILHWMASEFTQPPPKWSIHSANPVGRDNMAGFLRSWEKASRRL